MIDAELEEVKIDAFREALILDSVTVLGKKCCLSETFLLYLEHGRNENDFTP